MAGCATATRTEGTSGPLAWRATDMAVVTRTIQGQATDTYAFNLFVRNIGNQQLNLTKMSRTLYLVGGSQPSNTSVSGRWELGPGGEWKFPLYSYTHCSASQGCTERGSQQPMWQIVLTGTDEQNRPVESRFEIILPHQPTKHIDIGPVRKPAPSLEPVAAPTAAPPIRLDPATASASNSSVAPTLSMEAQPWRPGFEWEYSFDGPSGKGTFVWSVNRLETVDGDEYYVVRSAARREIYWRVRDRAYLMDKIPEGIETRRVPPTPIPWPLTVGTSWESRYVTERPIAKTSREEVRSCVVEKQERVAVPAGTFDTLKLVCTDPRSREVTGEFWFSPEARHWVKDRVKFDDGVRDRELL